MFRFSALGLLTACLTMLSGVASAYDPPRNGAPAEQRGYIASLPACDDPAILNDIAASFGAREWRFADGRLVVAAYERAVPVAFRPWGDDFIPRRFCSARARFSDGKLRQVDYSVREGLGFLGAWNVNWCVQGLDRHWTYQPDCTMARP